MQPAPLEASGHIAALRVYPVKSCAGIAVAQARMLATGLEWDRAWMLVDPEGAFMTQRDFPRMALVQPALTAAYLHLSAPGMAGLDIALQPSAKPQRVQVWDDSVLALDAGDAAAAWFAQFLGVAGCRLVRFDPAAVRLSSHKWTQGLDAPNQFADGYPVLVTSAAALDELNSRLKASGHPAAQLERFRPNIVLGGVPAHEEDFLKDLRLGTDVTLRLVKPCARCPIPNIDPRTAISHPGVGDALQAYRADARLQGAITFGMNAIVLAGQGQVVRVGDGVGASYAF